MSFNIDVKAEYQKWITWPDDSEEKYLIEYVYEDEYRKIYELASEQFAEAIYNKVKDWEGIQDKNGKDVPCNNEMKKIVFTQHGPASIKRFQWLWANMLNPRTFIDIDEQLKNLKRESE